MFQINRITSRTCSMLGQRGAIFGMAVLDAAKEDDKLMVLTADLATRQVLNRSAKI